MSLFVPNKKLPADLAKTAEYRAGLKDGAENVKRAAEAAAKAVGAPWMPRSGHETIEVTEEGDEVYVVNTDHGGHLMEYGSKNNPPHAPLRQGARSAGLTVDENA